MLHEFISKTAPQGPALPLQEGDALVVVLKVPAAGKSKTRLHVCFGPHETQKLANAMAADTFERFSGGECAQARRVCCFAPSERRDDAMLVDCEPQGREDNTTAPPFQKPSVSSS